MHMKRLYTGRSGVPSGVAGKGYMEEVTRLIKLWIQDTLLKSISLKALHVTPVFLLQKPYKSSKAKDIFKHLKYAQNCGGKVILKDCYTKV